MLVLGIETTCDETAAAVIERREDGSGRILSNVVHSQIKDHATFGGDARIRRAARLRRRHPDAERDEGLHQERIARATTDWWRAMLLGDATALRSLREQVRMD